MAPDKKLKVGIQVGGGEAPGYRWNCLYLSVARTEAMKFLNESQYHHLVDQFKEIAYLDDPTNTRAHDIEPIEDFFELRDKGDVLGKLNVRVFFAKYGKAKDLVVLGVEKKEEEGQTPSRVMVRMRRRKRWYEQLGKKTE